MESIVGVFIYAFVITIICTISNKGKKKKAALKRPVEPQHKPIDNGEDREKILRHLREMRERNSQPTNSQTLNDAGEGETMEEHAAHLQAMYEADEYPDRPRTAQPNISGLTSVEGESDEEHAAHWARMQEREQKRFEYREALQTASKERRETLRRAIVMNEILSRPVSLRDEEA